MRVEYEDILQLCMNVMEVCAGRVIQHGGRSFETHR